jgi:DNA-binding Xre family transcriptional regulator
MATKNRLMELLNQQGTTRYRFWQDTGLSRATAYRLCDDPTYIPTGDVIEKICRAYGWQPGDFIVYEPDEGK